MWLEPPGHTPDTFTHFLFRTKPLKRHITGRPGRWRPRRRPGPIKAAAAAADDDDDGDDGGVYFTGLPLR